MGNLFYEQLEKESEETDLTELVRDVLETLRDMDDAVDVICNLDAETVVKRMEGEV